MSGSAPASLVISLSVNRKVQPSSFEQDPSANTCVNFRKMQSNETKAESTVIPPRQCNFVKVALIPTSGVSKSSSTELPSRAVLKKESHLWPTPLSRTKLSSEGKMPEEETAGSDGGSDPIRRVRR